VRYKQITETDEQIIGKILLKYCRDFSFPQGTRYPVIFTTTRIIEKIQSFVELAMIKII